MNIIKFLKEIILSSKEKNIQVQNKRLEQELIELKRLEKEQINEYKKTLK